VRGGALVEQFGHIDVAIVEAGKAISPSPARNPTPARGVTWQLPCH